MEIRKLPSLIILLALVLGFLGAASTPAQATFYPVNNTSDAAATDGQCSAAHLGDGCSLREAVVSANNNSGADTIFFMLPTDVPQTISLDSPLPAMTEAVTVTGPGAKLLKVKATTPR